MISSHVRRSTSSRAGLIIALTIVEVDLAAAQVRLTAAPADTAEVEPGSYEFEVQVIDGDGRVTTFGADGGETLRLIVKGDTTHD